MIRHPVGHYRKTHAMLMGKIIDVDINNCSVQKMWGSLSQLPTERWYLWGCDERGTDFS